MNTKIKVSWFAKKYNETIFRNGVFDNQSKTWNDKKGNPCLTYFDTLRQGYRTAVNYQMKEVD
jgi:hypothetical protein